MTTTHEHAMRPPNAQRTAVLNESSPKTDPILPRTSNGNVSRTPTLRRYPQCAHTAEHAR